MKTSYLVSFYAFQRKQFSQWFFNKEEVKSVITEWCNNYPPDTYHFCWVDTFNDGVLVSSRGKGISRYNDSK